MPDAAQPRRSARNDVDQLGRPHDDVRTPRPASARLTPGAASASSRSSSSPMPGGTSSRSRTLPSTCTTQVTKSSTSSAGSADGQPAIATEGSWPSSSQHSSAVYGANSDSITASVSAASRTAGSAAPGPESIALRAALTSSISRATATLSRVASTSLVTSSMVRCVTLRSSTSPGAGGAAGDRRRRRRRPPARPGPGT